MQAYISPVICMSSSEYGQKAAVGKAMSLKMFFAILLYLSFLVGFVDANSKYDFLYIPMFCVYLAFNVNFNGIADVKCKHHFSCVRKSLESEKFSEQQSDSFFNRPDELRRNLALGQPTFQSSTKEYIVDGITCPGKSSATVDGNTLAVGPEKTSTRTDYHNGAVWWMVDLEGIYFITDVRILPILKGMVNCHQYNNTTY